MKNRKYLAVFALAILSVGCNKDKKNENSSFSIDSSTLKQAYSLNEALPLSIKNTENKAIDSVAYFINDIKIATSKGNAVLNYALSKEKFGSKEIKAIVYSGGSSSENTIKIDVFSDIQPVIWDYTIVNTYPHDIGAYTQGLEFYGDKLIESTGNGEGRSGKRGKSSVRIVNPKTGEALKKVELEDRIFGEGATVLNDKLYQLTYKNNEGYVYNIHTLEKEKTLPYFQKMEGWGLTNDGTHLYMTDGSDKVYILNPADFSKIDYFTVSTNRGTVYNVNELEWVNGKIYANFYGQDAIGVFDPKNGAVDAVINLSDLRSKVTQHEDLDVLNGIAYNKKTDTFFVTGKNWDKMFEIKINKK